MFSGWRGCNIVDKNNIRMSVKHLIIYLIQIKMVFMGDDSMVKKSAHLGSMHAREWECACLHVHQCMCMQAVSYSIQLLKMEQPSMQLIKRKQLRTLRLCLQHDSAYC